MRSWLAILFGEVADWERRHSSEGVTGHLIASGKEASLVRGARVFGRRFSRAFLGQLSFGPGPGIIVPIEFWAWPLGWADWLREPSPSPWYPQYQSQKINFIFLYIDFSYCMSAGPRYLNSFWD